MIQEFTSLFIVDTMNSTFNKNIKEMELKKTYVHGSIWEVDNPEGQNYFLALLGVFKNEDDTLAPPTQEQRDRAKQAGPIATHNVAYTFKQLSWAESFMAKVYTRC